MILQALPRSAPEAEGVPSAAVLALVRRLQDERLDPHSLILLRHGVEVASASWAPYRRDKRQLVYSVSKTFTGLAVAFAEAEGLLALTERVVDVFPEAAAAAGDRTARITLEHTVRMATGHVVDPWDQMRLHVADGDLVGAFLRCEPEQEPGSCFVYNNGASFVLGAAVQRRSGQRLVDYLRPRLLDRIGIAGATWSDDGHGRDLGFSGLHVTTEDLARLGQLLVRDGVWRGDEVLPAGWVSRMQQPHTDTALPDHSPDSRLGYGYQVWRSRHGYRADGAYGQFVLVLPEHDVVVALTGCAEDTQAVLEAVWQELLPHLAPAPLPVDEEQHGLLTDQLATLAVPALGSTAAPSGAGPWRFAHTPGGLHPALRSVEVRWREGGGELLVDDGGELLVPCGDGSWPETDSRWVASGGWRSPTIFHAMVLARETPHALYLTCQGGAVTPRWHGGEPLHRPALGELRAPT